MNLPSCSLPEWHEIRKTTDSRSKRTGYEKMEAEFGRIIKSTDAFALLSCPTPGTGKASFPRPWRFCSESGKWREWSVTGNVVLSRRVSEPFWFRQDAGTRNAKTPLVNPLTREACMKYLNTTDCSLFLAERSKFMTKYALIGVLAVCATVLCFY